MFTNVGWGELLIIGIVALVVLGPERLPEAIRWVSGTIRKVKDYAGAAQEQLRTEFGTDLDDFREPLAQLNELRGMSPRALVTKHLLDGDDAILTGDFGAAAPKGVAQAAPESGAAQPGAAATATSVPTAAPTGKAAIYQESRRARDAANAAGSHGAGSHVVAGGAAVTAPATPPPTPAGPASFDEVI